MKKTVLNVLLYLVLYFVIQITIGSVIGVIAMIYKYLAEGESLDVLLSPDNAESLSRNGWVVGLSSLLSNVVALIVFLKMRWGSLTWGAMKRGEIAAILAVSAALGLTQCMPISALTEWLQAKDILADTFEGMMNNVWGVLAICIGAPLGEELLFRGAIQRCLHGRVRPWAAILTSSLLFALIHGNPVQMVGGFTMGLVLGWLYYRTGSIWPGVMMHFVNNTLSTVFGWIYGIDAKNEDVIGTGWPSYLILLVLLLLFVGFLLMFNKKTNNYEPSFEVVAEPSQAEACHEDSVEK